MADLRVMAITAHPDDECGAFGGALMLAHQRGAGTSVICLTEGTAASHRGTARSDRELASMRRDEFAAGLRVLDVDHGEVLHYPDGHLADQNFLSVVTALVERIRRLRPQIVLTFGGDGGVNLHRDHAMASYFATAAFYWSGKDAFAPEQVRAGLAPYSPQKLYYSSPTFLVLHGAPPPAEMASVPTSLMLELGELKHRKYEAFAKHTTQAPLLAQIRSQFEKYAGEEGYLLAGATGAAGHMSTESDMFSSVLPDPPRHTPIPADGLPLSATILHDQEHH